MAEADALRLAIQDGRWWREFNAGALTTLKFKEPYWTEEIRAACELNEIELEQIEPHDRYLANAGVDPHAMLIALEGYVNGGSTVINVLARHPLLEGLLAMLGGNYVPVRPRGTGEDLVGDIDSALREHGPKAVVVFLVGREYWALPRRTQKRIAILLRRHVDFGGVAIVARRGNCFDHRDPKYRVYGGKKCTPKGVPIYPWGRHLLPGRDPVEYVDSDIAVFRGEPGPPQLGSLVLESLSRLIERSKGYEGQLRGLSGNLEPEKNREALRFLGEARRGRKGSGRRASTKRCARLLMPQVLELTEPALLAFDLGHYEPEVPRSTTIPKKSGGRRPIDVFPLGDRIMHGAVHLWLRDRLTYPLGEWAVGGRAGVGPEGVLADLRASLPANRDVWYAVVDIRKCFESVDQARLLTALSRHLGPELAAIIIRACVSPKSSGLGLPQGCPASMHLLNLLLAPVDRVVASKVGFYRRYVDDLVLVADTRGELAEGMRSLRRTLNYRGLALHPGKGTTEAQGAVIEYLNVQVSAEGFDLSDSEVGRLLQLRLEDPKAWRGARGHYWRLLGEETYQRVEARMFSLQFGPTIG